jgi:glycosyltransferase involved in cell wall biosynthesis
MKILFLVPYPINEAPSQRFRFEQYFCYLKQRGVEFTIQSFLSANNWRFFSMPGKLLQKSIALLEGFSKRLWALAIAKKYDYIFIHREASPIGPPLFEWVMAKILRKKVIYDFDDAIWLTDRQSEKLLLRWLKWRSKIATICKLSSTISVGNSYLADFARQFCAHTVLLPTTIDPTYHTVDGHGKNAVSSITIGWTGSYSTLKYLDLVSNVLQEIEREFPNVSILIIADQKPRLTLDKLQYKPWSIETEIEDLMSIDIGIMPIPDDEWARGKCGFKALQYMSLEIPTIASPIGVNKEIIDHGINGFLASTEKEWLENLRNLIVSSTLREEMGKKGKEKVVTHYSTSANAGLFLSLFQ